MKKFLFILALCCNGLLFGGNGPIVNPYQEYFNEAYSLHPQIPRGVLEAVSYTNTRFTHLTSQEDQSCTGMPQAMTLFGLIEDGQGWFRNNLTLVSVSGETRADEIKNDPHKTVLAYARAFEQMYFFNTVFVSARNHSTQERDDRDRLAMTLIAMSELHNDTSAGAQFAINSFVYSVMSFMCEESMAGTYGFPVYSFDLKALFGETNYQILTARKVSVTHSEVRDEHGNVFRNDEGSSVLSADYGPALWNPAASCNYSSRNSVAVSAVTIHTVQGTYAGCISWFQNCAASVSAHYVVRSSDGQITQMVYESLKAWHVGSENPYTVGIEHEGYVSNPAWYTVAMYTNSAALVADICADYSINPLRTGWWPWLPTTYYNQSSIPGSCTRVKGHQHYPNQTHSDPGVNWDWNYFYQLINPTPGATTYTAATGIFYDSGGQAGDYQDDERIITTIAPTNATSLTVNFNSFNAENTWDYLYVYDGNSINAPLIGYYTGTNNPGTIVASGGSLTFEWRSDCATVAPGWEATWSSNSTPPPQADNTSPTTQVAVAGIWQTQDFSASFTEADNAGGSGLEKSYYQVIDYDGSDWRANYTQGFFSDNFDLATIHPDWTSATGTWAINSGVLEQNDENLANTNIYAPLTQNLSNRYLYHWAGKIDGTGSNRRAGFHFFCDNPTATNRGNSYFVWFRVDQSVCEWYEVINDTFYLRNSVAMTVNANQWYDWKVIYDRITGKISVYQDNFYVGDWTDSSPLASGDYISFRSGNSNWQINNFKVYRSRYSNQPLNVTVGNCPSCELRYQNTNPSTPAGRVKSIVTDSAGNLSAVSYIDVNVDWTVPTPIDTVIDAYGTDIDTSQAPATLWGDWSLSNDPNSGLSRYWYAIGTSPCDTNVVAWTSNWGFDTVTVNNLTLTAGQWYYFSVKSEDGAGLMTPCYSSDGVLVDWTLSAFTTVSGAITANAGPNPFAQSSTLSYSLETNSKVRIVLYDNAGRQIVLADENQSAGNHVLEINSAELNLSSGLYFISIQTEKDQLVVPLVHKK